METAPPHVVAEHAVQLQKEKPIVARIDVLMAKKYAPPKDALHSVNALPLVDIVILSADAISINTAPPEVTAVYFSILVFEMNKVELIDSTVLNLQTSIVIDIITVELENDIEYKEQNAIRIEE
jgi:hypothetical protein